MDDPSSKRMFDFVNGTAGRAHLAHSLDNRAWLAWMRRLMGAIADFAADSMLLPPANASAHALFASVSASIFSITIRVHSQAPSEPPPAIFSIRIAITP
jgi:hypothetical protein